MDNTNEAHKADLLMKIIFGNATPEEEAEANELIKNDPAVRQELERLMALYEKPEVQALLKSIDPDLHYAKIVGRSKRRKLAWVAAASILLVAAGGIYFLLPGKKAPDPMAVTIKLASGKEVQLADSGTTHVGKATFSTSGSKATYNISDASTESNTLQIPRGKTYSLLLGDGSTIRLNAATVLKFPFTFSGPTREIYLDGEAFLQITPDPNHPFLVHTDSGTITVLGTTFNVNTYSRFTVSLQTGAVAVKNDRQSVRLTPGQESFVDSAGQMLTREFNPEEKFSWLTGKLMWDTITIKGLAAEIERHYNISVFIERAGIENIPYSVVLEPSRPLEVFLKNINSLDDNIRWELDHQGNLHIR